jgi:sulfate transport system ATP-binding protein
MRHEVRETMSIEVQSVTRRFDDFVALDNVSVSVPTGELVALLGPSGSGKTTLLRIIAGLETPDSGEVRFDGVPAATRKLGDRRVGFVFQHYALFRHLTVFENVAFGLRVRPRKERPSREAIAARVHELLRLVQLEGLDARHPSQLSGGQRQRVALARALAVEPRVLLLDEPFGALDAKVRQELRRWLRCLHDELHITSVFVTHDQEEALEVADRLVVMDRGRVQQVGAPTQVYDHPATPFVFDFLGSANLFHGRLSGGELHVADGLVVPAPDHAGAETAATAYVRPHDLMLERAAGGGPGLAAVVRHVNVAGAVARVELERADTGEPLAAELTRDALLALGIRAGETVRVRTRAARVFA